MKDYYKYLDELMLIYNKTDNANMQVIQKSKLITKYGLTTNETIACEKKLKDDKYVELMQSGISLVTLEGIMLIELGGYCQKIKDIKSERNHTYLSNVVIAFGTGLAGLYALVQFFQFLWEYFCFCP